MLTPVKTQLENIHGEFLEIVRALEQLRLNKKQQGTVNNLAMVCSCCMTELSELLCEVEERVRVRVVAAPSPLFGEEPSFFEAAKAKGGAL